MIDQCDAVASGTSDPLRSAAPRGPGGRAMARPNVFMHRVATVAEQFVPGFKSACPESAKRWLAQ